MKSATFERMPNAQRTELTRAKIIDAAIDLIAERGLSGFAMTDVGPRAGLSRSLAGYHFNSRAALIRAAGDVLLERLGRPSEFGIKPMMQEVSALLSRAERRDTGAVAMLQFAASPRARTDAPEQQKAYWDRMSANLAQHLSSGQNRGEVRADLDPQEAATLTLGQLHGELLKILALGSPTLPAFVDMLTTSLSVPERSPRKARKPGSGGAAETQPSLL